MWKQIGQSVPVKANRDLAKLFCAMTPMNPKIKKSKLEHHRREMLAGKFHGCVWKTGVYNGVDFCINGHTTSRLLADWPENVPFPDWPEDVPFPDFEIVVQSFQCETKDDLFKLYLKTDHRVTVKDSREVNLAVAAQVPRLQGQHLKQESINQTISAYSWHQWGWQAYQHIDLGVRAKVINQPEAAEFCLWLDHLLGADTHRGDSSTKHIRRVAVISAMLTTWQRASGDATDFWQQMRDGQTLAGANCCQPAGALRFYLAQTLIRGNPQRLRSGPGKQSIMDGKVDTGIVMHALCIQAWNAYRRGTTIKLRYYAGTGPNGNGVPEAI